MKLMTKLRYIAIIAAFAAVPFVAGVYVESAAAHDGEDHTEEVAQAEQNEEKQEDASVSYEYTAQPGDSFSQIARKAVQTYGLRHDVNLSVEQILFAETNLTLESDSPLLLLGQKVSLEESKVKEWVDKANELSDGQKAAWTPYTLGVDFNTNNVGEN